jgi:DNA invertase Pin-like site-specific DNA recombinase
MTSTNPKRVALYLRVSTGEQDVTNQRLELEAAATRHGWEIVQTFADEGISGSKGKDQRPGFAALHAGIARKDFDMICAWSVDRLGRSLQDLVGFLSDLRAKGLDLYLHKQGLDTSTPSGRMMFQMLGVFSEFERSMIQERIRAGLARARSQGKRLGRPPLSEKIKAKVRRARAEGHSVRRIARDLGIGVASVQRVSCPLVSR